jgi:VanZ family protein
VIRALRDWGPALAWAAAIFCVSGFPTVPVPMEHDLDKVFHFGAYGVLGAALAWGASRRALAPVLAALIGIAYGASDEIHQMFVPGRFPDMLDWVADSLGVAAGVALCYPLFARLAARGSRSRMP